MKKKPRLLDLFSGAGGCAMGYHRAGFDVSMGIDIAPQPNYPFDFYQWDALDFLEEYGHEYDFIHASPPCQNYSTLNNVNKREYPDLLPAVRVLLQSIGVPYVIENVPGAPIDKSLKLRGDMFGLQVLRLRYFETSFHVNCPPLPRKTGTTSGNGKKYSTLETGDFVTVTGKHYRYADGKKAMGIDWMSYEELAEAIPPVYTQYVGAEWLKANGFEYAYPGLNVPVQQSFLAALAV